MEIWILQTGEPLPVREGVRKMRTALLAEELASRGHRIVWWASTFDHLSKTETWREETEVQIAPRIVVRALQGLPYKTNVSIRRYRGNWRIARRFRDLAPLLPPPNAVLASLPDHLLAYEAVAFARDRGIPVLVDIRDQWPEIFLQAVPGVLRPLARLALVRDFSRFRTIVRNADSITSMMASILRWACDQVGRRRVGDRVYPLGAQPLRPPDPSMLPESLREALEGCKGRLVVAFIGTFGKYSNPTVLVRAARRLKERADLCFVVAGDGPFRGEVEKEARGLPNLTLPGWVDESGMAAILAASSIGILPSTEVRDIFPNKAFSYLSASLAVIASVEGDLKDLLGECRIGFHYPPNDDRALAESIRKLADNPDLLRTSRENSGKLFESRFRADKVYSDFADHVERVAAAPTKAGRLE